MGECAQKPKVLSVKRRGNNGDVVKLQGDCMGERGMAGEGDSQVHGESPQRASGARNEARIRKRTRGFCSLDRGSRRGGWRDGPFPHSQT